MAAITQSCPSIARPRPLGPKLRQRGRGKRPRADARLTRPSPERHRKGGASLRAEVPLLLPAAASPRARNCGPAQRPRWMRAEPGQPPRLPARRRQAAGRRAAGRAGGWATGLGPKPRPPHSHRPRARPRPPRAGAGCASCSSARLEGPGRRSGPASARPRPRARAGNPRPPDRSTRRAATGAAAAGRSAAGSSDRRAAVRWR